MSEATAHAMVGIMRGVTETGGTARQAAIEGYPVAGKTGTAQKAIGGHYDAQKYVASFVGFAPAQSPRIALMVVMDEPEGSHLGGAVAAPVFKEIGEQALRYLHVLPVGPVVAAASLPTRKSSASATASASSSDDDDSPAADLPPTDVSVAGDEEGVADDSARQWDEVAGAEGAPSDGAPAAKVDLPNFAGMTIAEAIRAAHRTGIELAFDESHGAASGVAIQQRPGPGPVPRGTLCRVAFGRRE